MLYNATATNSNVVTINLNNNVVYFYIIKLDFNIYYWKFKLFLKITLNIYTI